MVLTMRRDWFDEMRPTKQGITLFVAISIQFPLWMFPLYLLCIDFVSSMLDKIQEFLPFCLYLFQTEIIETSLSIIVQFATTIMGHLRDRNVSNALGIFVESAV